MENAFLLKLSFFVCLKQAFAIAFTWLQEMKILKLTTASSMVYIKKDDIVSNKPNVLEQEIYCVKIFHHQLFYSFNISPNTFWLDSKLTFTSVFINQKGINALNQLRIGVQWTKFNVSVQKVAFFPKKLFIHFYSGVGFLQRAEGGAEGRDRLSLP